MLPVQRLRCCPRCIQLVGGGGRFIRQKRLMLWQLQNTIAHGSLGLPHHTAQLRNQRGKLWPPTSTVQDQLFTRSSLKALRIFMLMVPRVYYRGGGNCVGVVVAPLLRGHTYKWAKSICMESSLKQLALYFKQLTLQCWWVSTVYSPL